MKFNMRNIPNIDANPIDYAFVGFIFSFLLFVIVDPLLKGDSTMHIFLLIIYVPIFTGFGALMGALIELKKGLFEKSDVSGKN
jgi:ABC-type multidrug transport system permease subunit